MKNISQIRLENYQQVCHEIKTIRNKLLEIIDRRETIKLVNDTLSECPQNVSHCIRISRHYTKYRCSIRLIKEDRFDTVEYPRNEILA